jgi:DNA repair photolyase
MASVEYAEITCKSALNRVQGMPFKWSLNPYVGCVHACQYCYARAYYVLAEHGSGGRDFETRILVKSNFATLLRQELRRPSWAGEMVALGTATDAYQPAEGRFRLTRRVIEALRDHANPLSLVTKSPMVFRDIDVLSDVARQTDVRVYFTITTVDTSLWHTLEPGTANPWKRLLVMQRLNEAGIPAGVILAPILPGITDSVESIHAVVKAAADHGASFFTASPLRLGATVREHYLDFIDREFPDLSDRYLQAYRRQHAPEDYRKKLDERVRRIQDEQGLPLQSLRGRSGALEGAGGPPPRRIQMTLPLWHDTDASLADKYPALIS